MIRKLAISLFILCLLQHANAQEKRYFTEKWFSVTEGFRNVKTSHTNVQNELNFLNYIYTKDHETDYQYLEFTAKLKRLDKYEVDARLAIYNNLIPYCYNLSYQRFFNHGFGIIGGSMSNRFYLIEFNGIYNSLIDKDINTRYINRQWHFSMLGFYLGPTYQISYNTIQLSLKFKAGMASIYPFQQRNIIKESQSNYKQVFDYQTRFNFAPFIMPEVVMSIDFIQYKKGIIGGQFKFAYLYTKTSVNYDLTTYEWTYDFPEIKIVKLPKRSFHQMDFDLGIFFRW